MSTIYYEIGNKFSDKNIRLEFIRKINSLLLIQLSITFGWTFYANDGYDLILYGNVSNTTQIAQYLLSNDGTTILFAVIFFMVITIFTTICCPNKEYDIDCDLKLSRKIINNKDEFNNDNNNINKLIRNQYMYEKHSLNSDIINLDVKIDTKFEILNIWNKNEGEIKLSKNNVFTKNSWFELKLIRKKQ